MRRERDLTKTVEDENHPDTAVHLFNCSKNKEKNERMFDGASGTISN